MAVQTKPQEETVGTVYASGQAAEVPAEVAAAWVLNGWASVGTAVADAPESTGFRAPTTK